MTNLQTGPPGAPLVSETWTITLAGSKLSFAVDRRPLQPAITTSAATSIVATRSPALVLETVHVVGHNGETPLSGAQIPSLLNLDLELASASQAFALPVDAGSGQVPWYELLLRAAPNKPLPVLLAPSRLRLQTTVATSAPAPASAALFSMAHPPSDGTTIFAMGIESIDRLARPAPRSVQSAPPSATYTLELDLQAPDANNGPSIFDFSLPQTPALATAAAELAQQYNLWLGWIIGNNPASTPCLHEMGFFPLMCGLFAVEPPSADVRLNAAMAKQLRLFSGPDFVLPSGYVMPRWTVSGPYNATWGPLHDQVPHYLIAVYQHAVNTGDKALADELMPAVDRVATYMLSLYSNGTLVVPGSLGLGTASTTIKCNATNWLVCNPAWISAWQF